PAHPAGRLQHLCGGDRDRQCDPAEDDLSRLLLVPRQRGSDHGAADRVPADIALAAERDELTPALILRSGRSERLEGWPRTQSLLPSFETPDLASRRRAPQDEGRRYASPRVTSSNSSSTANAREMIFCSTE